MDHGVTLLEVKRQTDTDGLCNGMPVTSATSHEVEAFSKMRLQFMVDYAGYPSAFLLHVKYTRSYHKCTLTAGFINVAWAEDKKMQFNYI